MSERLEVPARTVWARTLAYSRAVRVGRHVLVSGTLPVDEEGRLVGGDDAFLQAQQVLKLMLDALSKAGAATGDVVRLRIYLRDMEDLSAVAAAQFAIFEHVRPVCTVVHSRLAQDHFRVQMEADAILPVHRATRSGTSAA